MNGYLFDVGPPPVLSFGKYRGTEISKVPPGYLCWLMNEPTMRPNVKRAAAEEMARRADEAKAQAEQLSSMPTAAPCVVCGVALDEVEAGLFREAVECGELVIDPAMPLASPVPLAWKRYCELSSVEHAVREVGCNNEADG
jgi:hypothetical protein